MSATQPAQAGFATEQPVRPQLAAANHGPASANAPSHPTDQPDRCTICGQPITDPLYAGICPNCVETDEDHHA